MTTKKTLILALTLLTAGVLATSCSREDNAIEEEPQNHIPATSTITLTATLGFDSSTTRALAADGTKTFDEGDQIALIYTQVGGTVAKAVSAALPEGDYGNSAEFTFTLDDPDTSEPVRYIYPAAMAKEPIAADATMDDAGTVDYSNLANQDGTLDNIGKNYDLATFSGAWDGDNLPTATLANQLAILAINLKDGNSGVSITSGLTQVTIGDGANTYTVSPKSGSTTFGQDVIYVAIRPTATSNEDITVTATDGTNNYTKLLTGKDYKAGNFYNIGLLLGVDAVKNINDGTVEVPAGKHWYIKGTGEATSNQITIGAGATVTLDGVNISSSNSCITCNGDAAIFLADGSTNSLTSTMNNNPALKAGGTGTTLTIGGSGSLTATGGAEAAGIGSGKAGQCGDINISGGTITATGGVWAAGIGSGKDGACGNISISGGTVTATGGYWGAGIGRGRRGECRDISISGGTVEATGGSYAAGIGSGYDDGACRNISISGGTVEAKGGEDAAGIGSGSAGQCGNITISGGTVEATGGSNGAGIGSGKDDGACGNISISGGTVEAKGGSNGAGIGGGSAGQCGKITIANTVTSVTATKGNDAPNSIGAGDSGTCKTVTIGGTVYWENNGYVNGGDTYLTQSQLVYPAPKE